MVPTFFWTDFGQKKGACGNATSRKKWSLAYKMPIWLQKKGPKKLAEILANFFVKFLAEILVKILGQNLGRNFGGIFQRH